MYKDVASSDIKAINDKGPYQSQKIELGVYLDPFRLYSDIVDYFKGRKVDYIDANGKRQSERVTEHSSFVTDDTSYSGMYNVDTDHPLWKIVIGEYFTKLIDIGYKSYKFDDAFTIDFDPNGTSEQMDAAVTKTTRLISFLRGVAEQKLPGRRIAILPNINSAALQKLTLAGSAHITSEVTKFWKDVDGAFFESNVRNDQCQKAGWIEYAARNYKKYYPTIALEHPNLLKIALDYAYNKQDADEITNYLDSNFVYDTYNINSCSNDSVNGGFPRKPRKKGNYIALEENQVTVTP